MTRVLSVLLAAALAACGVETATTAATSAEIKKREMEQAKNTMEQAKQKIDAANQQVQKRTEEAGGDDK